MITPDIEELLADSGGDASMLGDTTKFSARISSDVSVRPGDRVHLAVDAAKFQFFDPANGHRIGK